MVVNDVMLPSASLVSSTSNLTTIPELVPQANSKSITAVVSVISDTVASYAVHRRPKNGVVDSKVTVPELVSVSIVITPNTSSAPPTLPSV